MQEYSIDMSEMNGLNYAQTCWVIPDIAVTVDYFSNLLGISFPKPQLVRAQDLNMRYYGEVVAAEWLATQTYAGTFIELVQPLSGRSMFHDFLADCPDGGIQHQAFRIPISGFEHVIRRFRDQGYKLISEVDHPIARMAFFDTYNALGTVTEIMGVTPEGWKAIAQMQMADGK